MARVMLVDDNPDVRYLLRRILEEAGYEIAEAASGEAALEALGETPADAVLLDVQMPGISGWETLERIREQENGSRTAVILCTVRGSPDSVKRGYALGCDAYLAKPFDIDQVSEVVRQVIGDRA